MKMSFRTVGLSFLLVVITSVSFAQKKNETSAAVEFKNRFTTAFAKGDMEAAKKSLISAKEFIDLAAAHPDTKDNPKTMWLKGEIYSYFMIVGIQDQDLEFVKLAGEDGLDQSINSFAYGYTLGKKFKSDIENSVYQKVILINTQAGLLYTAEQYVAAAELYTVQSRYSAAINEFDSSAIYNASLCHEKAENYLAAAEGYERLAKVRYRGTNSAILASSAYRKVGNIEKAKEIIADALKDHPTDRDLLLELVNTNIDTGDAAGAEAALNDAIATDPTNKQLHYTIGTIYIDLGENEKAEAALNKALELDPDYEDAQYQLGAHLVTWAGNIKTEANQLKFGDPNYNRLILQGEETYKRALIPLEKYIISFPNVKVVLMILFQLHRNIGNSEKALEYKRRADEATE
jgi:tetratricopeptide (TPR) repeat protein